MQIGSQMSTMTTGQTIDISKMSARIMQDADTDESGGISTDELQEMGKFGELLAQSDTDGDGVISEEELSAKISEDMESGKMPPPPPPPPMDSESMSENIIEMLDTDGSGDISTSELEAMEALSQQIGQSDADGDGIITKDELSAQIAQEMEQRGDMPPPPEGEGREDMSLNSFKDILTSLSESDEETSDMSAIDKIKNYLTQLNFSEEDGDSFLNMLENNRFDVSA